ncbi:MAG TPA: outer membrane protein assembly factor BamD [Candidatus Binataceae bacterium]|nr:outer membrane protein assembly factor BamD [Candidatus Binataceae bacterium]
MHEASTDRWWRVMAVAAIAALIAGCAANSPDVDQLSNNQFALRGLIATDRQQIDALNEKVSQLQDQIDELRHGGGGGSGNSAEMKALERRVSKLESAANTSGGAAALPPGAPGAASSPAAPPMPGAAAGEIPGAPAPGSGEEAAVPPPAPGETPPPEFETGAPPAGAPGEAGEENGGENAPPAPSAAEGPDWHAAIDREIAAANASSDPAAPLYSKGLEQMKAGQYQDASDRFSTLMRRFPKSPLSEPAEYFSANALYELGKYDQAILQFNDLAMRFPNGRFACAALLREGQAFIQINDRIDARLTLQKLISDHNECPEASAANSMMKNLASD